MSRFQNERRQRAYTLPREHFDDMQAGRLAPKFSELPADIVPAFMSPHLRFLTNEITILATSESFSELAEGQARELHELPLEEVTAGYRWPSPLAEHAWRRLQPALPKLSAPPWKPITSEDRDRLRQAIERSPTSGRTRIAARFEADSAEEDVNVLRLAVAAIEDVAGRRGIPLDLVRTTQES